LSGHLADISCLIPVSGIWDNMAVGRRRDTSTTNQVNFLTGGMDGMVLSWGGRHDRRIHGDNDGFRRRLSRGDVFISHQSPSSHEETQFFKDVDTW